jgi:diphthamide biosynthesis protein 2
MVCHLLSILLTKSEARVRDADETANTKDASDPEFSLISGTLRSKKTYGSGAAEQEVVEGVKDLTLRNQDFSLSKLESAGSESPCTFIRHS